MAESVQVDWKGLRGQALIQHTQRVIARAVYSPRPSILLMILSRYPHDQKCLRPRPRRVIFIRGHARASNCQKVAGQVALALTRSFVLCCLERREYLHGIIIIIYKKPIEGLLVS
jgi:hypothetical protein